MASVSPRRQIQGITKDVVAEPLERKMKKHSHEEILSKLARANELARAGNSQMEICKALGVSVMTLHRWRKMPLHKSDATFAQCGTLENGGSANAGTMDDMRGVLEDLTVENQRFRKIVADLLLEKTRLEEALAAAVRAGQSRA
nr:helix-turn-helix domain-containing protein [Bradyrhizobium elkanii]